MSFPLVDYESDNDSDDPNSLEKVNSVLSSNTSSTQQNFFSAQDADSSSGEDNKIEEETKEGLKSRTEELKNPFRSMDGVLTRSVLSNPFKQAEDAEKSSLEKHVKLAPKIEDVREINGRKICWNYRKGRCRFGSNCIYAHDSELLQKNKELVNFKEQTITSTGFDDKDTKARNSTNNKRFASDHSTTEAKKSKATK